MTKSQLTMERIGSLRDRIENDLKGFEAGRRENFVLMVECPTIGLVVPHNWIDKYTDWVEEWHEFMHGQTICGPGVYYRDVYRFLSIMETRHGRKNNSR